MAVKAWLVYRAGDNGLRVVKNRPSLAWDEIAWGITLTVPPPWGRIAGNVDIVLPEAPPAEVTVTEIAAPTTGSGT